MNSVVSAAVALMVLCGARVAPAGDCVPQALFAEAVHYEAESQPFSVAASDLDGDGDRDLAVSNWRSGTVSILLNAGTGVFTPAPGEALSVGEWPVQVVVQDFDGMFGPDIATANRGGGIDDDISILLSTGAGEFAAEFRIGVGDDPFSLAAGDFDENGHADIAVALRDEDRVNVLLNSGGAVFSPAPDQPFRTCKGPHGVSVGELNGSEGLDLVVANEDDSTVRVLFGDGDGSFNPSTCIGVGEGPQSVSIADFNGDGHLDLAAVCILGDEVTVLLNDGAGDFSPTGEDGVSTGDGPQHIAHGDLNGDGHVDLVVANFHDDDVSVLLGSGNGAFETHQRFSVGSGPHGVAVADLNGDGAPDLAVANRNAGVSVLLNQCGPFCASDWTGNGVVNAGDVGAFLNDYFLDQSKGTTNADFNGDGVTNAADVGEFLSAYFADLSNPVCTGGD